MRKQYYSPGGYWKGAAAITKLAEAANVSEQEARDFLKRQAIWQIYLPAPKNIARPHFIETVPNDLHQADLLYLPHDRLAPKKIYKYALVVVDVASRFKAAEPLTERSSKAVAVALQRIYDRGPLTWPKLIQVDSGSEFKGVVNNLLEEHNVKIRRGIPRVHRQQAIVERFNSTLAESIFGAQYAEELRLAFEGSLKRSKAWVRDLQDIVNAKNHETTRMTGLKPVDAIKMENVVQPQNKVGLKDPVDATVRVRYLYAPGELEGGGERHRATDPIWSVKVYDIDRVVRLEGFPPLYYLRDGPKRNFVREELMVVPDNTET